MRQAAKPWARPAVDEGAGEALGAMGVELGAGIKREASRLAKKGVGRPPMAVVAGVQASLGLGERRLHHGPEPGHGRHEQHGEQRQ